MHLAQRAYALLILTAVLAIAGLWSSESALSGLWLFPAALLLTGLALESSHIRRTGIHARIDIEPRAFLGRTQAAVFAFHNASNRDVRIEYAPVAATAS